MNQGHPDDNGGNGAAVPRDLPDQHARPGEDPLDVDVEGLGSSDEPEDAPDTAEAPDEPDQSLPDADEAGAGRRGEPNTGGVHPEQPVPDEPSG
ncbi:hypothetical protein [Streptomyces sp. NPDC058595]|uniref:hypothetical protein n=1 Tax=unclassified Streptomyces TaxID=2593676 RepID=UPI0036574A91|nr:hypothetical protein OG705_32710 [Streptomyces sp. NBC_00838]